MCVNRYAIILAFTIVLSCTNRKTEEQTNIAEIKEEQPQQEPQLGENTTAMKETEQKQADKYDTVVIGSQVWMSKNLDVSHFRNGDKIPYAATAEEWKKAGENKSPAWCYYDNDEANGDKYGKLYNWYAVNDARGLAPDGWNVPKKKDWEYLEKELGNLTVHADKLMSTAEWLHKEGTNKTGLNGLPAGGRFLNGKYRNIGESAYFWTSTIEPHNYDGDERAFLFMLNLELPMITAYPKEYGLSVRCIK